jgi:hypothetical protein
LAFAVFSHYKGSGKEYTIKCSYLEIYNEQITDLLNPAEKKKLNLREDGQKGVFVENLSGILLFCLPCLTMLERVITSPEEALSALEIGSQFR